MLRWFFGPSPYTRFDLTFVAIAAGGLGGDAHFYQYAVLFVIWFIIAVGGESVFDWRSRKGKA